MTVAGVSPWRRRGPAMQPATMREELEGLYKQGWEAGLIAGKGLGGAQAFMDAVKEVTGLAQAAMHAGDDAGAERLASLAESLSQLSRDALATVPQ